MPGPKDKREKNIKEGRGFRAMSMLEKKSSGSFEFASSNEMWRATLDLLDFTPLSNVDYSGGVILGKKFNKRLGVFAEGKYNKYWNREWYDFKMGINYIIR